ncbi:DNA-3-methyladenine glycosylase [Streptomyces fodineus]|uniref:DNA-3-methyladenine glycosylase II n=1 Tax=Streptomyces fodineus TaxID=1904616 RepID=A0A1D7YBD1_9ACTN|nr:DNA-3-methyladenine glycosylase [Streptomyces fodineus]AOR32938.1 DNA-3-methyladenine glycosylase [Streptomyces fodineus]
MTSQLSHSTVLHLPARPPFDFTKSLGFLTSFPTMSGEHGVQGQAITRAVREGGRLVAAVLSGAGPDEGPGLRCELRSDTALNEEEKAAVADRLSFFLGLDDDLEEFYAKARGDDPFRPVLERLYGYHQVKFPSPFEMLCWAILAQRVPMPVARKMKQALLERCGNRLVVDGEEHWAFPEVDQLLPLSEAELLTLVGNQRKAGYLYALFRHWVDIDEQFLRTGDYEKVRERLLAIPGVGPWSASFVLIRGLGRMEHLSADKEMLRAAARVYGRVLGEAEFAGLADRYAEQRGYWGHYLRVAG